MKTGLTILAATLALACTGACASQEVYHAEVPEEAPAGWDVHTARLVDLMADPDTFPIMHKHIPHIVAQIEFGTGIQVPLYFTLEHFLGVPEAQINEDDLAAIQEDLDKINAELGLAVAPRRDSE